MELLQTLPNLEPKDSPGYRELFSAEAMEHPGRMRVALALNVLQYLAPKGRKLKTVLDIFCGVGTTAIAAAILGFRGFIGIDIDPRWISQIITMISSQYPQLEATIAQVSAADAASWLGMDGAADLLLCSPEFPNAHTQGKGPMQEGLREQKQCVAGTEYADGRAWYGEKRFKAQLLACIGGSKRLLCQGAPAGVHIKNYVRDNKEVRADLWVAEILEHHGFEVAGYLKVPLAVRSKFQNDQRYPLRKVVTTDTSDLSQLLDCGHTKIRSEPPKVWPQSARCVECGPIPDRVEILEERVVVARRVR